MVDVSFSSQEMNVLNQLTIGEHQPFNIYHVPVCQNLHCLRSQGFWMDSGCPLHRYLCSLSGWWSWLNTARPGSNSIERQVYFACDEIFHVMFTMVDTHVPTSDAPAKSTRYLSYIPVLPKNEVHQPCKSAHSFHPTSSSETDFELEPVFCSPEVRPKVSHVPNKNLVLSISISTGRVLRLLEVLYLLKKFEIMWNNP